MPDEPTDLTCSRCGATFSLPARVRERYPGWTPDLCRDCHRQREGAGSGQATLDDARSSRSRSGGRGRRQPLVEQNLTIIEVLERYTDGPDSGVFTDGSAVPNPGPGGWGAVYVVDGDVIDQAYGHDPDTTNNRMEFQAVIAGCDLVPEGRPATVYTDSRLVHDTVNEWAAGWKRRGWKRKTGPVKNLDLVKQAYARFDARPELSLAWVPAHNGYRWNEYADSLSTAWMRDEL